VTDEITLTLPRERDFYGIAHLVLGGLAVRLDLTFETLEDLQLALASVLERPDSDGNINLTLRVEDHALEAFVGPFDPVGLHAHLERRTREDLSVARLLETVVDQVSVDERDDAAWIHLTKTVEAVH
jgi:anti-sigma regulatory factor (Ser/Thr protein kinase)